MHGTIELADNIDQKTATERAWSLPLEEFDPGDPELFQSDTHWPYFDRLRREEPVHYCKDSIFGPYWSITKYNDIMDVETNHSAFSSASALGGITIRDVAPDLRRESFIAMDQPRHSAQRKTVAPMFTPTHLDQLAINIRKRSAECLDNLPIHEAFDWVDRVSIELTTQMLAVLFDFPWEDRRKLTRWSDIATTLPGAGGLVAIVLADGNAVTDVLVVLPFLIVDRDGARRVGARRNRHRRGECREPGRKHGERDDDHEQHERQQGPGVRALVNVDRMRRQNVLQYEVERRDRDRRRDRQREPQAHVLPSTDLSGAMSANE